jgi:hypothetical protein
VLPESLGAIHRAEEILRVHERMWMADGMREGSVRGAGG